MVKLSSEEKETVRRQRDSIFQNNGLEKVQRI